MQAGLMRMGMGICICICSTNQGTPSSSKLIPSAPAANLSSGLNVYSTQVMEGKEEGVA